MQNTLHKSYNDDTFEVDFEATASMYGMKVKIVKDPQGPFDKVRKFKIAIVDFDGSIAVRHKDGTYEVFLSDEYVIKN